ncbi:16S rRNA (cytosine(967)-C(5))-methyltransferase RsmB [Thiohalorhabdus methylotrophus]|uniref:16S rRNA (cytosine(967)-C(5))-methyltransferase n=1 Tax=Thiohalorhabdus methylotrophus TaxID=3242694 RepID=A0ABV4TQ48_9GAMM
MPAQARKPSSREPAAPGGKVRRRAAAAVAGVLREGRRLEAELDYEGLDQADRALLRELATGTVRWAIRLRAALDGLLDRPLPRKEKRLEALLLVGLYQLAHSGIPPYAAVSATVSALTGRQAWARGLVNGVLRRFGREREARLAVVDEQSPAMRTAYPEWLVEAVRTAYPAEWMAVLEAGNAAPPLTLRVRGDRTAYLAELAAAGIPARALDPADGAVQLEEHRPVTEIPGFTEGRVSIQDGAAQLAADLLAPRAGDRILDACSAPGGKLAHLLDRAPQAEALAVEADEGRLERIRDTLQRLGLEATALIPGDATDPDAWWDGRAFDRILVDAPCSGTGVTRRHPDIKHHRRPEDIPALAERQGALLRALWPLLRPGGTLVYATCSILPTENREVVAAFLEECPEARCVTPEAAWGRPVGPGRQILPGEAGMDGFFYACLERAGGQP